MVLFQTTGGGITVGNSQPTNTLGNLWADTSIIPPRLKQYDGTNWVIIGIIVGSTTPLNPINGELWIDTTAATNPLLKRYDNTSYKAEPVISRQTATLGASQSIGAAWTDVTSMTVTLVNRAGGSAVILFTINFLHPTVGTDIFFRISDNGVAQNSITKTITVANYNEVAFLAWVAPTDGRVVKLQCQTSAGNVTVLGTANNQTRMDVYEVS